MEQLVARRAHNPKVTGSSPVPATLERDASASFFCYTSVNSSLGSYPPRRTQVCLLFPLHWKGMLRHPFFVTAV